MLEICLKGTPPGDGGKASSSSGHATAPPAAVLPRSCCVHPLPTSGPAPLCPGRRQEVGCPGPALVAMPAGRAAARPRLDGAGAFPALPQSSPERMSRYPVPVGRAVVSPSEKDYQIIQLRFRFCLSRLLLMLFWHCMKQLRPEARISMDTCFSGGSSLAQLHPRSPIYPPASTAALPTPQPACLWASSKAPTAGQELGSQHGWGPRLHPITHVGAQPASPVHTHGAGVVPLPLTPIAIPQHPLRKVPEPRASTEIPNSKALLGIQQLLSVIINF